MTEPHRPRVKYVIGPDGSPLTIADLPSPKTKRWVIRRKAEVVAAVRGGLLSLGSVQPLRLDGRRIPFLAIFNRPTRSGRLAQHPHSAVSPATERLRRLADLSTSASTSSTWTTTACTCGIGASTKPRSGMTNCLRRGQLHHPELHRWLQGLPRHHISRRRPQHQSSQ